MIYIAYQNHLPVFVAETKDFFQPPMYGLRSDYEDLFAYEAAKKELEARLAAAKAEQNTARVNQLEGERCKVEVERADIAAKLEAAEKAEEQDPALIAELEAQDEEANAKLAAIKAELDVLTAPVREIEAEIAALVKPDKVLPFVLLDRIEEHEGRAKIVGGKVLFDTDIDVAEMKALEEQYTAQVQAMLDEAAKALGYDSCLSVCSYIDTGVEKFDKEGVQFRRWRSAIWARGYELLDEVKAGKRPVPTPEELPGLMPKLEEFAEVMQRKADNSEQPEQDEAGA